MRTQTIEIIAKYKNITNQTDNKKIILSFITLTKFGSKIKNFILI